MVVVHRYFVHLFLSVRQRFYLKCSEQIVGAVLAV